MRRKYDYKVATKSEGESLHEKELQALGEGGWLLTTTVQRSESEGTIEVDGFPQQVKTQVVDFIFIRPVPSTYLNLDPEKFEVRQ